jgi:hypothetical protein
MVIVETAGTVYLSSMQDKASSERRSHVRGTRSHYEGMRRLRCLRSRVFNVSLKRGLVFGFHGIHSHVCRTLSDGLTVRQYSDGLFEISATEGVFKTHVTRLGNTVTLSGHMIVIELPPRQLMHLESGMWLLRSRGLSHGNR